MTNIKLSKRLFSIAKMVEQGSMVADVGCDHALLDIYLSQNNIIKKAIACDITEGALQGARKNIKESNVKNVEVRLADGLSKIKDNDNVDTLVISGLGDQKIISILNNEKNKLKNIHTIIVQSNTGIDKVRINVVKLGYFIKDETLVKEKGIIYTVIKFKKGIRKYSSKQMYFGPVLLMNKNELFNELLLNIINKNKKIISSLPNTMVWKKLKLFIKNIKIKKEMSKKTD